MGRDTDLNSMKYNTEWPQVDNRQPCSLPSFLNQRPWQEYMENHKATLTHPLFAAHVRLLPHIPAVFRLLL